MSVTTGRGSATSIYLVEARVAAEHPTTHLEIKNYLAQNIHRAEVEKA